MEINEITSGITKKNDDDLVYEEELKKLIIPKKIIRSKLSEAVTNLKNIGVSKQIKKS